jgi:undecaprenyl diphosphate synthase
MSLLNHIDPLKCPKHIAVIMDGNGRWAKQQGEERIFGHASGVEAVREVLKGCVESGVRFLTLYTFSTENWNRPKEEVDGLMNLMVETISNEVQELDKNGVRLRCIGDISQLPENCKNALLDGMKATQNNSNVDLILALNYSARWEIVNAMRTIAQSIEKGELTHMSIDDKLIAAHLSTKDYPDPELLIRTSGEFRLSNFLLWQIAYTELYFTNKLWPEFTKEDLFAAIVDYQNRERRFGMVSEQITKS